MKTNPKRRRRCALPAHSKLLANDVARILVVTDAEQSRVTKLVVLCPLDEADLDDDLRADPVGAETRKAHGASEWRLWNF
jgi:hypothetical protein